MGWEAALGSGLGAIGLGAGLMGSSDAGGPSRKQQLTPGQFSLLEQITGRLGDEFGTGVDSYDFSVVPEASTLQRIMGEMAERELPDRLSTMAQTGSDLLQSREWNPEMAENRWMETVVNPSQRRFEEETLPAITEKFAGMGGLDSSGFNRALVDAGTNLATQQQSQLADLMYRDRESALNRNLQRTQLGSSLLGQTIGNLGQLGQIGQQLRGIDQQQLQERLSKWQMEQPQNNPWMQNYLSAALGTQPYRFVNEKPGLGYQIGSGLLGGGIGLGTSAIGSTFG